MQLPFTAEQFFGVFRLYNSTVWPAQVFLLAIAGVAVISIALARRWSGTVVSTSVAILWVWLGAIYHLVFFVPVNPAAYVFGALSIAGGLVLAWQGVYRRRLVFGLRRNLRTGVGLALIVFALLVYPAWSTLAGHAYPELPTFGLPCPTTIFTIGVLALSSGPGLRAVLAVPILWSLVGSQAALLLGVTPDFGLLGAGFVAMGLFARPAWGMPPAPGGN